MTGNAYMDTEAIRTTADRLSEMSERIRVIDQQIEAAHMVVRTTAFVGMVGGRAVEDYLSRTKPELEDLSSRYDELSEDLKQTLEMWLTGVAPDEPETDAALQGRLITEAGSINNATARNAIDSLRSLGWLTKKDKVQALRGVNLEFADLDSTDLSEGFLAGANLRRANLSFADLRDADLSAANLAVVNLRNAHLESANLSDANLSQADLHNAQLDDTHLDNAQFHAETRLPDGRNWSEGYVSALDRLRAAGAIWDDARPPYEVDDDGNAVEG